MGAPWEKIGLAEAERLRHALVIIERGIERRLLLGHPDEVGSRRIPLQSTGTGPIFSSRTKREARLVPRPCVASTHAVPMVGWPAKGTSRAGVKMRRGRRVVGT
jgi:hypothetical protein